MQHVELFRHTDNEGDRLTDEGIRRAVQIGESLTGRYRLAVSSGAQRATQTVACLLAGLGQQVPRGVMVEEGLRSLREDDWRAAYREAGSGTLQAFRAVAPDLVEDEAAALGAALERIFDRLEQGERALVVGHSPTNEAAVLGLTGVEVEPLEEGEKVVLVGDEQGYRVEPFG